MYLAIVFKIKQRSLFQFNEARLTFLQKAMSGDSESGRDVIERFSKPSRTMSDHERQTELGVACECAKETLRRGAAGLVRDAGGRPLLSSKSCDGTPLTVVRNDSYRMASGKRATSG